MKKVFGILMCMGLCLAIATPSNAQFNQKKKKGAAGGNTTGGTTENTSGTTNSGSASVSNSSSSTSAPVKPGKTFDTAASAGGSKEFGVDVKPSLRNNYGHDKGSSLDAKVLPWDHIREEDAVYSQIIWREIDAREKQNKMFLYGAKEDNGDQRFMAILLSAIKNDSVTAFSADGGDDRFTVPMTYDEVLAKVASQGAALDTQLVENLTDPNVLDTIIQRKVNPFAPKPDSIYTFRIKEQVMFDKETSRMVTRIIGIAPVAKVAPVKGQPSVEQTLFWVYYPELRGALAKYFAYNPKNASARMSWEQVFESRYFSSYIVKSTLNNPGDKRLKDMIKDPLYRLYEGETIKETIFNYEQDLWSY
jgi:gliding motility associated protien GldN